MKDQFGKCSDCGLEMDSALHQMRCVGPTLIDPRDAEIASLRGRLERAEKIVATAKDLVRELVSKKPRQDYISAVMTELVNAVQKNALKASEGDQAEPPS